MTTWKRGNAILGRAIWSESEKRTRSNCCVYIVWKSVYHTSCDGGVCCPLASSPHECMAAAWSQAQGEVLVPALQSSHRAQTHPTSVHACGLSGLKNVHVETFNRQHGPNLVLITTRSIASLHILTITRPYPETSQQLKHRVSSVATLYHGTLCEHTGEVKDNLVLDFK